MWTLVKCLGLIIGYHILLYKQVIPGCLHSTCPLCFHISIALGWEHPYTYFCHCLTIFLEFLKMKWNFQGKLKFRFLLKKTLKKCRPNCLKTLYLEDDFGLFIFKDNDKMFCSVVLLLSFHFIFLFLNGYIFPTILILSRCPRLPVVYF